MTSVYLDFSAKTPVADEVLQEMLPYFSKNFGNPSSIHQYGQKSKAALETARERVASVIQARSAEILFVSGGTESINLAIRNGLASGNGTVHLITTAVEHRAVLETCRQLEKNGVSVTYLQPDTYGMIHPNHIADAIRPETRLISIMHVNNEIGTINPIAEIGEISHERGILFHTDAVQSFGKLPIDVNKMNIDLLSCSAHKIYGPKGVGALYIRQGIPFNKLIFGGEQERNRRGGTENIPGIVGFGKAAELCGRETTRRSDHLKNLQNLLWDKIRENIPDVFLNGHPIRRLPGNLNIAFTGIDANSLLISLDMKGIAASNGSACSSGSSKPSHVLAGIGLPPEKINGTLRISLGRTNTIEEIEYTAKVLVEEVKRIRLLRNKSR